MSDRIYTPILNNNIKSHFDSCISKIHIPLIDYYAVGLQNRVTRKSSSYMSNKDWQNHFVANQYANFDPLRELVLSSNRNIIFMDEVDSSSSLGIEIMNQRKKFYIRNGIILVHRQPTFNIMVTLGSGYSKFNCSEFFKKNIQDIKLTGSALIKKMLIQI